MNERQVQEGSRTGGKRTSKLAQTVLNAPTRLAEQWAPAMTWPTPIQRWQRSGTVRPTENKHQTLWQQAAFSKLPEGAASVGIDGAPL